MAMVRPLVALGHLWMLLAVAYSAAVPTQDTMVVSRFDGITDPVLSDPNPTTVSTSELTTEEHTPPIKLTEMDVKSVITMRYAHTAVVAHVRNPAKRAQEAHFRVLLPETAFISGFVMTIDGKSYKAYVKEKEEAKQIYQEAVSHGQGAAYIATKARDSNHFTVSVNVEPASNAIFNLTYEELLVRRNDVYNHAINLHPGALVPKFTVSVNIKETANISELRVPEIRTGNEIDASKNDAQMSNVIIQREGRSAVITFSPDLEEQKRLMDVYAEKSKESAIGESNKEGVLGQFVVQYDVDRSKEGEVLVNAGYFVHFFAPELPPLNKYVVFVLDTSGSMMGIKIEQLKQAMQTIFNEINPGDYFSIIDFDSTVSIHSLDEVDKEPPKRHYYYNDVQHELNLVKPSKATPDNIEKARVIINRLEAYGGTNINSALNIAVDLINEYGRRPSETHVSSNSSATVSTPTTTETTDVEKKSETAANDEIKNLEPIIIFLTDGDPTVGVTDTKTIINHVTEKNYGENKAPIYALAFGDDADRKFLRKLSLRNEGFVRLIYEGADAPLQLRDFYRQVSSPLLANVKFTYPPDQVNEDTTTRHRFRTFYAGSELVVAGRVIDSAKDLDTQVFGFCGVEDDGISKKKYTKKVKVPIPAEKDEDLPLERLWAYLTIKQLMDQMDASDYSDNNEENSPEKKALQLALKYSFVTPLTSLVVVKPNETNAVNAESVDKQSNSPQYSFQPLSLPGSVSFASYLLPAPAGGHLAAPAPHWSYSQPQSSLFVPSAFVDSAVPETDEDYEMVTVRPQPTWDLQSSTYSTITTVIIQQPGLHTYHLEDYSWAESLLDATKDALVLQANETVTLNLTRNAQAPKASDGDASCTNAVDGGDGFCVYLTRCYEARNITADLYKTNYCIVDGGYAGVCCHKTKIDITTEVPANDKPSS